jgi:predicted ATP-grasp superfamily ATP-dependent carboligase
MSNPLTVNAEDVRRLLACEEGDAALVAIEGRIEVVTPAQLESPDYRGALQIATRDDVVERAGGAELSDRELAEQAEELDTAVRNLGA